MEGDRAGFQPRLLALLLSEKSGKPLNTAKIGRRLEVSRPTALARVRVLERLGFVRLLPFLARGGRRMLYLRDGFDFRAFAIDAIASKLSRLAPESRLCWWKTGRVRQIDLVVETDQQRIGFCFAASSFRYNRYWLPLRRALRRGVIQRGFSLHNGEWAYFAGPEIYSLPLSAFLKDAEYWVFGNFTEWEARRAIGLINRR